MVKFTRNREGGGFFSGGNGYGGSRGVFDSDPDEFVAEVRQPSRAGVVENYRQRAARYASQLEGVAFVDDSWMDVAPEATVQRSASLAGDATIAPYLRKFEPEWSRRGFATEATFLAWRAATGRPISHRTTRGGAGENVSPPFSGLDGAAYASNNPHFTQENSPSTQLPSLGISEAVQGVGEPDCRPRPTGDPHGPGRWRGEWFNWCRDE